MTDERLRYLLDRLTLDEKITLLTGADFFDTREIKRLDIPSIRLSDGPHGVRAQSKGAADHLGLNASSAATCFPSGAAMGSAWNPELTATVAEAIGEEAHFYGINVMLGPAFNIKRSPLCGRNFEYYSEDPFLAGKLAASYIRGIQSTGVAACPKHFACNNQEDRRMVSNSIVDERTLREVYLSAFEIAVKEGHPWSIMCAYNMINETFCSESKTLLNEILRIKWGFNGAVISDWGAVSNRAKAASAGLDLEMPGTDRFSDASLKDGLSDGTVTINEINNCVANLLTLLDKTKIKDSTQGDIFARHHDLAGRIAEECLVLLKNENNILPLHKKMKIAVLGALAENPRYQGGGSSHVASWKVDQPLACLMEAAVKADITYAPGYYLSDGNLIDEDLLKDARQLALDADVSVIFIGLTEQYETEGSDRKDMSLPEAHNELVNQICTVNSNTVVVLTAGAPVEMPWIDAVRGLILTYTAGDGLGSALAKILVGKVNPSGKLAETLPLCLEHNPSYLNFRESKRNIYYAEGVFVGYRWYEKRKLPVLFPFGFGLSYTSFSYSNLKLNKLVMEENDALFVNVDITNTGEMTGKECVQLYISPTKTSIPRPVKELKGFAKPELSPGETKTVSFTLNWRSFAFYDTQTCDWSVEPGVFVICVGASSRDIRCTAEITLKAREWHSLESVNSQTTFGELVGNSITYPIICDLLKDSPMYRPAEMPEAPEFLLNLPLWTLNHMAGHPITPSQLQEYIDTLNKALKTVVSSNT